MYNLLWTPVGGATNEKCGPKEPVSKRKEERGTILYQIRPYRSCFTTAGEATCMIKGVELEKRYETLFMMCGATTGPFKLRLFVHKTTTRNAYNSDARTVHCVHPLVHISQLSPHPLKRAFFPLSSSILTFRPPNPPLLSLPSPQSPPAKKVLL